MIKMLKNLLGLKPKEDFKSLFHNGAQIIDVRTRDEYQSGHIRGSVNIPLQSLDRGISKIRKDKPVITCCASGMRSAAAKNMLIGKGFNEVHNGGGWKNLKATIS